MNMRARLISPIYAQGEPDRPTPAEREARRQEAFREAWQRHGIAALDPADIDDDWLRQAVINLANRRYGTPARHSAGSVGGKGRK